MSIPSRLPAPPTTAPEGRWRRRAVGAWLGLLLTAGFGAEVGAGQRASAPQQDARSAQRKLEQARRELGEVASQRRRIEGQRGQLARRLRALDERVGASTRALEQAQARLERRQQELQQLQARRDGLRDKLDVRRAQLRRLLRAAHAVGGQTPLKLLLAQDSLAEGRRLLAYHGYLQRDQARRIGALQAKLAELAALEREIGRDTEALAQACVRQRARLRQLEQDRLQRSRSLAELERKMGDARSRERALGRDVKGLERVLAQLRAAARRAEAGRRQRSRSGSGSGRGGHARGGAAAAVVQVGGLGWPLSGALITAYGGTLPDGRRSSGILIGAPAGAPVRAVADGEVVFAEWMAGYGLICIVDHGDGVMSLYANNDGLLKDVGTQVKRGDTIASVGNSGGQGRTGLYFELRRAGAPVDPGAWLGGKR